MFRVVSFYNFGVYDPNIRGSIVKFEVSRVTNSTNKNISWPSMKGNNLVYISFKETWAAPNRATPKSCYLLKKVSNVPKESQRFQKTLKNNNPTIQKTNFKKKQKKINSKKSQTNPKIKTSEKTSSTKTTHTKSKQNEKTKYKTI